MSHNSKLWWIPVVGQVIGYVIEIVKLVKAKKQEGHHE
jgi:hypothetical protein